MQIRKIVWLSEKGIQLSNFFNIRFWYCARCTIQVPKKNLRSLKKIVLTLTYRRQFWNDALEILTHIVTCAQFFSFKRGHNIDIYCSVGRVQASHPKGPVGILPYGKMYLKTSIKFQPIYLYSSSKIKPKELPWYITSSLRHFEV